MNQNVEVILPELWAVNSKWIELGWIKELSPISDFGNSKNKYASLTNDGVLILKKESEFYPILKKFIPRIMKYTDQELQYRSREMEQKENPNGYEKIYLNCMQWEIKRRKVKNAYLKKHPKYLKESIRKLFRK